MLSRTAEGIYWMARYLERVGFISRVLQLQAEALVDRPLREINFGWRRIYSALNLHPQGGMLGEQSLDDFHVIDAYLLTDDLTFARETPQSLINCYEQGRENARQVRHYISDEMWTALNSDFLEIRDVELKDIWQGTPAQFYAQVSTSIDTFGGVATATMYRDQGWHFLRLGQFVERIQGFSALLTSQVSLRDVSGEFLEDDWRSLLRVFHALDAYNQRYSIDIDPDLALDLLVTDSGLPDSLRRCVDRAVQELETIGDGPDSARSQALRRLAGRSSALLRFDWPDETDRLDLLNRVVNYSRQLHDDLTSIYFNYPISRPPGVS